MRVGGAPPHGHTPKLIDVKSCPVRRLSAIRKHVPVLTSSRRPILGSVKAVRLVDQSPPRQHSDG